jgi:membrane protein YqaA with SNARE-associated domain
LFHAVRTPAIPVTAVEERAFGAAAGGCFAYTGSCTLNAIKHIFAKYSAWIWVLLQPLGPWGVLAIAALDASFMGLPMDVVVAGYVYKNPRFFLLYVFMASTGSALGSLVLYAIGYAGGEKLLRKRVSPERFARIHRYFERHEFWALMFPAMLPPPTPFKLFVLAAAVFEMNWIHFLLAIFAGRFVRFLALSLFTIKFGPQFVHLTGDFFQQHFSWVLGALALGLVAWLVVRRLRRKPASEQLQTRA